MKNMLGVLLLALCTHSAFAETATPPTEASDPFIASLPGFIDGPEGSPQPLRLVCAQLYRVRLIWKSPTMEFATAIFPSDGNQVDGAQRTTEVYVNQWHQTELDNRVSKLNTYYLNQKNAFAGHVETRLLISDRPGSNDERFRKAGDVVSQSCSTQVSGTEWADCTSWTHLGNMFDKGIGVSCTEQDLQAAGIK